MDYDIEKLRFTPEDLEIYKEEIGNKVTRTQTKKCFVIEVAKLLMQGCYANSRNMDNDQEEDARISVRGAAALYLQLEEDGYFND